MTEAIQGLLRGENDVPLIPYVNPASTSTAGIVKVDGETINVDENGVIRASGGDSRNIGEIIYSSLPLVDAGLHPLDGALIPGGGVYDDFVQYIAEMYEENPNANYFTTEAEWRTSIINYGVCGKFVYDSEANTVRLPKVGNQFYTSGFNKAPVVGNGKTMGLTTNGSNLISVGGVTETIGGNNLSSIGYANGTGFLPVTTTTRYVSGIGFGLTKSAADSNIYADLSDITAPLECYYYIVVATSTKTDIQVDIDEIATDLNGKADVDLTNTTPTMSFATAMDNSGIRTVVETYINGTSWYRVYSDGWCVQGGYAINVGEPHGTVTLLKPYIDTNYSILCTAFSNSGEGISPYITGTLSSNQFYLRNKEYGSTVKVNIYWRTEGYIK